MKITKKTIAIVIVLLLGGAYAIYAVKNRVPFEKQKPAVNEIAPEVALADLSGRMLRLSDFQEKIVLLNFWASWCPPCTAEMPGFQKVYTEYEGKGFAVIGIAINEVSQPLIRDMGIIYPIVISNERVAKNYGDISHVPVSFLVGRDGRIIRKVKGVYAEEELRTDLEKALKTGG